MSNNSSSPDLALDPLVLLGQDVQVLQTNLNDLFMLIMGGIVLFMQVGFALLEGGAVQTKNATNIFLKNVTDMCAGSLAFWACGFALAFGQGSPVIGLSHFFALGLPASQYSFMFFQSTFATTCATIISGAIAERSDFRYEHSDIYIPVHPFPFQKKLKKNAL